MAKNKKKKMTVSPDFTLNDDFEPFNEHDSIFGRIKWDKELKSYKRFMYDKVSDIIDEDLVGYTQIDHALAIASWTVHDYFRNAFSWDKLGSPANVMPGAELKKYDVNEKNIEKITKTIKAVAKSFGGNISANLSMIN